MSDRPSIRRSLAYLTPTPLRFEEGPDHPVGGVRSRAGWFRLSFWLLLLALLPVLSVRAQVTNSFDVFVNSTISGDKPGLYFVDARTGLSTVVVTNGTRHTLLEDGVLFQENETGVIKVAFPDGRITLHAAMQPTAVGATLNWVTSANHRRLLWSVSQRTDTSLLSDLYIAESDSSEKKLALHTSSTRNIDTVPLAITDDGTTVFYSRQVIAQKDYQLFPSFGDIFKLDVATGQSMQLPAGCACALGVSTDGRRFARLEPAADKKGFAVHIWDLSIKSDAQIPPLPISHTQAGYLILSRDGSLAMYTSARGVPPAKGIPPERYALTLVDLARREQRLMTDPLLSSVRAITFEPDNSSVLVIGVDKDGTYKLSLKDATLLPVSPYTFLGTITSHA